MSVTAEWAWRRLAVVPVVALAVLAVPGRGVGASVSVSFDGGQTWQAAHVSGQAGHYLATFTAPAGAKVTLRTQATDAGGGSIDETIINGYQIAA
jgi:hypothetical protein